MAEDKEADVNMGSIARLLDEQNVPTNNRWCDINHLTEWALRYREQFRQPTTDPVVNSVIHKFVSRHYTGMIKYGVSMYDNPLPIEKWIDHAQEELMDGILYLERFKIELKK